MKTFIPMLVILGLVFVGLFGSFTFGFNEGLKAKEKPRFVQPAPSPEPSKCSRCGASWDKDKMKAYKDGSKPEILLCPRCVYDQAASFLKFCPVEE